MVGFEPTHDGVKVHCLSTWLHPNVLENYQIIIIETLLYLFNLKKNTFFNLWARRDLNPRHRSS